MKNIKNQLLSVGAFVIGFASVAIIGGALISSAKAADNECSYSKTESKSTKTEYAVNANGQTYCDGTADILPEDYPDLIGATATNGKQGYVYKEDFFDEYIPSYPEDAVAYMNVLQELNEQGIYFQLIPVYAVDGKTVIGDFEISIDVGLCSNGTLSMEYIEERTKLHEEARANGKYLRESITTVVERAKAEAEDKK